MQVAALLNRLFVLIAEEWFMCGWTGLGPTHPLTHSKTFVLLPGFGDYE